MSRPLLIVALFLLIMLVLGFGIQEPGLAGVFSDHVSGARAQDETTYASSAVGIATGGGWMTPKVLGRFYLVKPPLLIWLAGLSMRTLGISRFALRFPVLIAGTLATLLLFLWCERRYSRWIAVVATILVIANPLWHTFSRVCYTDMLLALAMIGALWTFDQDWELARPRSIFLFAAFIAVGLMAKNVAGLLPVAIAGLSCILARRRPPFANLLKSLAITGLLVGPWHLYQALTHPRWFWTDYVQIQLLQFGLQPPVQPSSDGPIWFYLKRLLFTDPLLALLAAIAIPFLIRALREGKQEAAMLLSWILVTSGALLVFHYRNLPYLLYSIPPLCVIAAVYSVSQLANRPKLVVCALLALLCVKAGAGNQEPWGLSFASTESVTPAKWLRWYAELRRPNELIAINSDDEYYATALPIAKIRYCYLDPTQIARRYAPRYAFLGITVSTAQFENLDRWEPQFRQRLQRWGLASAAPIATNIMADSNSDLVHLIELRPQSDFYLPSSLAAQLPEGVRNSRRIVQVSPDRSFVLAQEPPDRQYSRTRWTMPTDW